MDELSAALAADGIRALPYHAGLDDATRHRNQDAFLNEEVDVMVATVAFGMGIDRSDVRFVVHAGAPQSLEQYQQEAGRAGRDGLPAECALVTSPADFARWRSLLESDGQWTDSARTLLRDMERYAAATSCRHRALVGYFGQELRHGRVRRVRLVPGRARARRRPAGAGAEDPVGGARARDSAGASATSSRCCAARPPRRSPRAGTTPSACSACCARCPPPNCAATSTSSRKAGSSAAPAISTRRCRSAPRGAELLRGQAECVLFRQPRPVRSRQRRQGPRTDASWAGVDQGLFEKLRALRLELARGRGVPPYVIFHDQTLRELARVKPRANHELHDITGIGERKAAAFGPAILDLIAPGA